MGRGLILFLAASLAVNVFLGGYVVGGALNDKRDRGPTAFHEHPSKHHGKGPKMGPDKGVVDLSLRAFAKVPGLSPEGRKTIRRAFMRNKRVIRETHMAIHYARLDLAEFFAAQQWETEAVKQARAAVRTAEEAHRDVLDETLFAAFSSLSLADRQAIVSAYRDGLERWEHRYQGHHGGNPKDEPPKK